MLSAFGMNCSNTDDTEITSTYSDNFPSKKSDTIETDFNSFLTLFNSDSAFQLSSIDFPMKVQEINRESDHELTEKIIDKSNYKRLDLSDNLSNSNNNFTREIKINNNSATVEIRGIESGVKVDFFFERENGKWKLITWIDSST